MIALQTCYKLLFSAGALAIGFPQVVFGQTNNPIATVAQRGNSAIGIRAGAFMILPELSVSTLYSDNVGRDENEEKSDLLTLIQPRTVIGSNWSVHSLKVEAGSEIAIHQDEGDEDYEDLFALGEFQLDILRRTQLSIGTEVRKSHVARDDPDDVGANDLTDFYQYGAAVNLQHQFSRLDVRASLGALRSDYDDNEDDQDDLVYDFGFRVGYLVSPRIQVFNEVLYNIEDRDDNVDDAGSERDSDGYEARFGVGLDITSVLSGEAFVGYRVQQFEEEDFGDETGLSFGMDLNWNPTMLTSVSLIGSRDFEATDEAGAASNFRTSAKVLVDHELRRNLIISGNTSYTNNNFRGGDRQDDTIGFGLGVRYLMNRNITLDLSYDYLDTNSSEDDESFNVNEMRAGFTLLR